MTKKYDEEITLSDNHRLRLLLRICLLAIDVVLVFVAIAVFMMTIYAVFLNSSNIMTIPSVFLCFGIFCIYLPIKLYGCVERKFKIIYKSANLCICLMVSIIFSIMLTFLSQLANYTFLMASKMSKIYKIN